MTPSLTRRRFLSISAAVGALAASEASAMPVARWRGQALGAQTSMQLSGLDDAEAQPIFRAVELELVRLERIFSLYRADSQIVRLNASGFLRGPAPELLELLSLCDRLFQSTGGAFDPTLQPMWVLRGKRGRSVSRQETEEAQSLVGWKGVDLSGNAIEFRQRGMALTLNGVAQGYVTDRIKALLTARGLRNALIDMGEIAALGSRPDGAGWKAGIALPDGELVHRVTLKSRALATSAPEGTLLDAESGLGHILDPRDPAREPVNRLVSVSAPQAAIADGLSTAGCLLSSVELGQAIGSFPDTKLEAFI